ncbi:MAG: FlgO family outer membrane protein [Bradymonadia bacterium]
MKRALLTLALTFASPLVASAEDDPSTVQSGVYTLTSKLVDGLKARDPGGLRRVAVLPLEALDEEASRHKLGRVTSELMSSKLLDEPRLLQVERAQLEAVIAELKRSESGALDPAGAASVGKLLGANAIILGTVSTTGPTFVITARTVDAETGEVLSAADSSFPRGSMVALSEDMVEVKSRTGAALRSVVLPGWGQLYNGDTGRGVTYGALFGLAAAGAIGSAVLGSQAENEYNENRPDTVDRRADANDHYDRANIMLVAMGAVWAVALVDAWLTGEDREQIVVKPLPGGGQAGLGWRF